MSPAVPEARSKPAEWYQVTYNLAAQKAHFALEPGKDERLPEFLRRLSLFRDRAEEGRRRRLLLEAHDHAQNLLHQAAISILTDDRAAEQPRGRRRPERLDEKLRTFLEETVEPTAAVLLAGLTKTAGLGFRERQAITTRQDLVDALRTGTPAPDALVAYVTQRQELPFRVRYNLACYYADESAGIAWDNFRVALTSAPRLEATVLADWAQRDPSLEPLRSARREDFDRFVRLYRVPTFEVETPTKTPESTTTSQTAETRESTEALEEPGLPEEREEAGLREEREEPEDEPPLPMGRA